MRLSRRRIVAGAVGVIAALFIFAITRTEATPPRAGVPLGTLEWSDCDAGECATLTVPLDHGEPGGPTIELAVARHWATGERVGVLIVNPGGPGGSGVAFAEALARSNPVLASSFDIVGWDPRGTGGSVPLACDAGFAAFYGHEASPDDAAERVALEQAASAAVADCEQAYGAVLPHLGTNSVVEDLELLREALGETQISYFGASYGTTIGLVYASRYGPNLRALVLDGVLDPRFSLEEWLTSQAIALEAALDTLLGDNIGAYDEVQRRAEESADPIDPQSLAHAAISTTYRPSERDAFNDAVIAATNGDGSPLRGLAAGYTTSPSFDAYTAVSCIDHAPPEGVAAYQQFSETLHEAAPRLGATVANELLPCATWPAVARPAIDTLSAQGAPPILVVGNLGDGATPYVDAVSVAADLDQAVLVTFDGTGHTSYGEGSECVDQIVNAYLVDLTVPAPNVVCQ